MGAVEEGRDAQSNNFQSALCAFVSSGPRAAVRHVDGYSPRLRRRADEEPYRKRYGHLVGLARGTESGGRASEEPARSASR